jgi:hypothetical protein
VRYRIKCRSAGYLQDLLFWVRSMVSNCANPACGQPLQHLTDGRLFRIEVRPLDGARTAFRTSKPNKGTKQISNFWLCGSCAALFTLTFDPVRGVQVVPLTSVQAAVNSTQATQSQQK